MVSKSTERAVISIRLMVLFFRTKSPGSHFLVFGVRTLGFGTSLIVNPVAVTPLYMVLGIIGSKEIATGMVKLSKARFAEA